MEDFYVWQILHHKKCNFIPSYQQLLMHSYQLNVCEISLETNINNNISILCAFKNFEDSYF